MLDDRLGIRIAPTSKSRSAFAAVCKEIRAAGRLLSLFATAKDIALLNSDIANRKRQQAIGQANLLALFGVEKKSAADI